MKNRYPVEAVLFGPFVGDFNQEITTFIPYVNWIREILQPKHVFVCTHANRLFLYDIPDNQKIPIPLKYTINEDNQIGYNHKLFSKREQTTYTKKIKKQISMDFNIPLKSIYAYTLGFTSIQQIIPPFLKINNSIKSKYAYKKKDFILYIPAKTDTEERINDLYTLFKQAELPIIVAGDSKIYLQSENVLQELKTFYTKEVYTNLFDLIQLCKIVVCPASHWTYLAQLQNVPVFSWGDKAINYKNYAHNVFITNKSTTPEIIFEQFLWNYSTL